MIKTNVFQLAPYSYKACIEDMACSGSDRDLLMYRNGLAGLSNQNQQRTFGLGKLFVTQIPFLVIHVGIYLLCWVHLPSREPINVK